ncbi:hypothetical protein E2W85_23590 [Salmonella enterica]|nr:hypothetical protein [Salmonella enterica]EEG9159101.1 hypothetical protein [Salmonella enterica]
MTYINLEDEGNLDYSLFSAAYVGSLLSPVPYSWAMEKTMPQQNDFSEAKAICNEIGGAVLEVLGRKRALSAQSLIDIIEEARAGNFIYTVERKQGMERAVYILKKFIQP